MARRETPFAERVNAAFLRVGAHARPVGHHPAQLRRRNPPARGRRTTSSSTNADALIIYGQEQLAIIDAVTTLTSRGIPVVTMISDIPTSPRLAYVGIDHYSAGRTAAFFMARMARRPGPVLVLCHSFDYRAHAERVSGFRDGLRDHAADMSILDVIEGQDRQTESESLRPESNPAQHRSRSRASTIPAARTARSPGRSTRSNWTARPVFIGHELSIHTARMLSTGVMTLTIDQNPEEQARRAIDVLLRRFGHTETPPEPNDVAFTIFGPENIPPAGADRDTTVGPPAEPAEPRPRAPPDWKPSPDSPFRGLRRPLDN